MPRYSVTYSVCKYYELEFDAESSEDAKQMYYEAHLQPDAEAIWMNTQLDEVKEI